MHVAFTQGKGEDKGQLSFTTSQVPSKKRPKPSRKRIRNTTDDKDLWVFKERVQSNVKGKDLSL